MVLMCVDPAYAWNKGCVDRNHVDGVVGPGSLPVVVTSIPGKASVGSGTPRRRVDRTGRKAVAPVRVKHSPRQPGGLRRGDVLRRWAAGV